MKEHTILLDFEKGDGLIPVIVQDRTTLRVLMLGYMNAPAYERTLERHQVTFYSRSRACLWTKGETSGNYLLIDGPQDIYPDCDNDTLLIKATPTGPTCHRGTVSCFDTEPQEGFIKHLETVIQKRNESRPEGSYTTRLLREGVGRMAQKVGEEAVETVIEAMAGNRERLIYESSDLIYHLLVLLTSQGITLKEIESELLRRA